MFKGKKYGVKSPGLKFDLSRRLKDISTPGLFNPILFNHEVFNPMVQKFMVEKSRINKFMVKTSGVERFRLEACG